MVNSAFMIEMTKTSAVVFMKTEEKTEKNLFFKKST